MHRENMIALSHQYGKQFEHIQELDKVNFRDPKTIGYSKGAAVNFNRFGYEFSFVVELRTSLVSRRDFNSRENFYRYQIFYYNA